MNYKIQDGHPFGSTPAVMTLRLVLKKTIFILLSLNKLIYYKLS